MSKIMLEHVKTGVVYAYCDILATHPDMRRLIVDDEQEVAPQAAAAVEAAKASTAARSRKRAAAQAEVVVETAPVVEPAAEQPVVEAPAGDFDLDGFEA